MRLFGLVVAIVCFINAVVFEASASEEGKTPQFASTNLGRATDFSKKDIRSAEWLRRVSEVVPVGGSSGATLTNVGFNLVDSVASDGSSRVRVRGGLSKLSLSAPAAVEVIVNW